LTELCDEKELDSIIIKAKNYDTLTLTTQSCGRANDFIFRDEYVQKNGGSHVILTFVPYLDSEFAKI
jgi:hypothetical protein